MIIFTVFYFFFSSRRRHTRCYRDWSSDVCSSDLLRRDRPQVPGDTLGGVAWHLWPITAQGSLTRLLGQPAIRAARRTWERSEERRVGKECRAGKWEYDEKEKKKNKENRGNASIRV